MKPSGIHEPDGPFQETVNQPMPSNCGSSIQRNVNVMLNAVNKLSEQT